MFETNINISRIFGGTRGQRFPDFRGLLPGCPLLRALLPRRASSCSPDRIPAGEASAVPASSGGTALLSLHYPCQTYTVCHYLWGVPDLHISDLLAHVRHTPSTLSAFHAIERLLSVRLYLLQTELLFSCRTDLLCRKTSVSLAQRQQ